MISAPDVSSIYEVPLNYEKDGMGDILCDVLGLDRRPTDLSAWEHFVEKSHNGGETLPIAVVGKYFESGEFVLADSYISVLESLKHAAYANDVKLKISYLDSEVYEKDPSKLEDLAQYRGILVPGGFGTRGVEGIIAAIRFARERKIPYFGLCYGMQLAVIEHARNCAGLAGANTVEISKDAPHPVIDVLPDQVERLTKQDYGGTMRLGKYGCVLTEGTVAHAAYGIEKISERHRHRYEVNPEYIARLEQSGLVFSGKSPSGVLMEIAELPTSVHPFFLGTQFHPEFQSRPLSPHPLFVAFIKAVAQHHV